jgi:hypothetical protein
LRLWQGREEIRGATRYLEEVCIADLPHYLAWPAFVTEN